MLYPITYTMYSTKTAFVDKTDTDHYHHLKEATNRKWAEKLFTVNRRKSTS